MAETFSAVEVGGFVRREEECVFCVRVKVGPPAWGIGSGGVVERVVDCVGEEGRVDDL